MPQTFDAALDPAPRKYPAAVTLLKRSARGIAAAPAATTLADIEYWLLHESSIESELLLFVESFIWRLVVAGIPLDRFTLHMGTLHPQLIGFAWNWKSDDKLVDEVKVADAAALSQSFLLNPLHRVREHGETIRRAPHAPGAVEEFPILGELAADGIVDYIAFPLSSAGRRNMMTIATKRAPGFGGAELTQLEHLLRLFALHVERYSALRISGRRVSSGADVYAAMTAIQRRASAGGRL